MSKDINENLGLLQNHIPTCVCNQDCAGDLFSQHVPDKAGQPEMWMPTLGLQSSESQTLFCMCDVGNIGDPSRFCMPELYLKHILSAVINNERK